MAIVKAIHTWDQVRLYMSQRDNGAPGSGVWSNPTIIFDANVAYPQYGGVGSVSAGALTGSDPFGIVSLANSGPLLYLGNGAPDVPSPMPNPGDIGSTLDFYDASIGAWDYNGIKYALANKSTDNSVNMLQSTDNGVTWTPADGSNAPPNRNVVGISCQRIGNMVTVFIPTTVGTDWAFYPFNLVTGTWGAPFGTISLPNTGQWLIDVFLNAHTRFANGDYAIIYPKNATVIYRELSSGGTWGAEITLPGSSLAQMLVDPSGELLHVWTYSTGATNSAVDYSTVQHGGTVIPTITQIPAPVGGTDGVGHSSIQNGMVFVPRDDFADKDNAVWVSTLPVTTFSKELLPIPAGEQNAVSTLTINSAGTGYAVNDTGYVNGGTASNPCTYKVSAIGAGGAVTAISVLNQGGGYALATGATTVTGGVQPGAGSGLKVNITAILAGKSPCCAYMVFPNGLVGSSVTLACPITNLLTINQSYSGSLQVTGGTAPFTYAIIGGMLPPGLTLNTSTGAITGTPTVPGTFNYEAQVTDANGNVGTAFCSFIVQGVVAPISPCANIAPQPTTDVQMTLRRLYVSMRPHSRMPVRGS